MKMLMPREFYIPQGATKVADKNSDGVAYIYTTARGTPAAVAFYGKRSKPVFHFTFASEQARANRVAQFFKSLRASAQFKAEQRAARNKPHTLKVGNILSSCWGYEQTNVNFYEVTALVGQNTVELREIACADRDSTGYMQGTCTPAPGSFLKGSKPMRKRVSMAGGGPSVRINSSQSASLWDGKPMFWSSYH